MYVISGKFSPIIIFIFTKNNYIDVCDGANSLLRSERYSSL